MLFFHPAIALAPVADSSREQFSSSRARKEVRHRLTGYDARDYQRARQLLEASGFKPAGDWGWECSFDDASGSIRIDLHRHVTPDRFHIPLDFGRLWERREHAAILDRQIPTLSREDALVILCIQLAKDAWGESALRLSKVCDIAELIRFQPAMDWEFVRSMSKTMGCRRIVEVSLGVAGRLLGPLPAIAIELDARTTRTLLEDYVIAKLCGAETRAAKPPIPPDAFYFRIRERWRDKAHPHLLDISARLRPNERDYAMVSLPASMRFLYFLVRPIRLARDGLNRLFVRRG